MTVTEQVQPQQVEQQLRAIWLALKELSERVDEVERELGPEED